MHLQMCAHRQKTHMLIKQVSKIWGCPWSPAGPTEGVIKMVLGGAKPLFFLSHLQKMNGDIMVLILSFQTQKN